MNARGILKKIAGNGGGKAKLRPTTSEHAASTVTKLEQRHGENQERREHAKKRLAALETQRVETLVQSPGSSGARNLFTGERDELQAAEAEAERSEKALELANQKLEASRGGEPDEAELVEIQTKFGAAKERLDGSIGAFLSALSAFEEARAFALSRLGRTHVICEQPVGILGVARRRLTLWLSAPTNQNERWMQ